MKLIFLSNYYTHHQKPVCEEWYRLTDKSFAFVSTECFSEERKQMGWGSDTSPFAVEYEDCTQSDIEGAKNVILGSAPLQAVQGRLNNKKTVFKYSERVFKKGYSYIKWLPRLYSYYRMYGRHKTLYLLAASAFASADFAMHRTFIGKSYKWGYFPETKHYDIKALLSKKEISRILWCGRLINWKHPEATIELAKHLRADGVEFKLDIIGNGELKDKLQSDIKDNGLQSCVSILGTMSPEQVRAQMERAGIYIFTSDFNEGWGAVLNEAMNSGCAVVASHAIGSVPFMLMHGENGLVYSNGNAHDLYRKVKALLRHPQKQKELGEKAYSTVMELWNAELAAKRFMLFAEEIEKNGSCDLFEDGPCSKAAVIKNNWFKEGNYSVSWIED